MAYEKEEKERKQRKIQEAKEAELKKRQVYFNNTIKIYLTVGLS